MGTRNDDDRSIRTMTNISLHPVHDTAVVFQRFVVKRPLFIPGTRE